MSKDAKNVPALRFKGFSDDWEKRKLGELAEFINGRAYKQDELLASGKYPVLRVGNFYTNDKWYYSNLELPEKYYAEEGDLLYTWSATFGPHIWIGPRVIYHYHIWKVALKNIFEKDFALQFFEADRVRLLNSTNGSTMIHVTKKDMESKGVLLPDVYEQRTIGDLLKRVDHLIAATQHRINAFEEIKEASPQHLFVQEWKFRGHSSPWKQVKLGEIADFERAKNGNVYPAGTSTLQISATRGQIGYLEHAGTIESKYAAIIPMAGLNPRYLNIILKKNIDEFMCKYMAGLNIPLNDLRHFPVEICNHETQEAVARVVMLIDEKKAGAEHELAYLLELKQALLQRMML